MTLRNGWARLGKALASLDITLVCLALLMLLVACCTLAQVRLGTEGAVRAYMRSPFLYWTPAWAGRPIPIFPAGGCVGALLLANLVAAQFQRMALRPDKAGLWVAHLGLILLFLGEFGTAFFQVETQMALELGQTRGYTESPRETEIALIDESAPAADEVFSVPESVFSRKARIAHPRLPFALLVKRYYANSVLERMDGADPGPPSMASQGAGARINVFEQPPVTRDDRPNQVSAFVELVNGGRSLGTWLLSTGLGAPQSVFYQGRRWRLELRRRRRYLPFSITLKEFRHDRYPGTDIPRNYSSLVRLKNPGTGEERDALIYMNNPLRYGGRTFYQVDFGKEDTLSVLQVVRNPGWRLPYLACALTALGLLWHFSVKLRAGAPRPS